MAAIAGGMSVHEAVVTSLSNLTSAGQFAGTTLLNAGASLLEVALTQLVINARYFLMSISMTQKIEPGLSWWKRACMAFGITDEIYAIAIGQSGRVGFAWFMGLMSLPVAGWTAGTWLGGAAGDVLPPDVVNALGLAMYGMFIAVLVPAARKQKTVALCIVLAAAVSCVLTFVPGLNRLSTGWNIIITGLGVSAWMAWRHPVDQEDKR